MHLVGLLRLTIPMICKLTTLTLKKSLLVIIPRQYLGTNSGRLLAWVWNWSMCCVEKYPCWRYGYVYQNTAEGLKRLCPIHTLHGTKPVSGPMQRRQHRRTHRIAARVRSGTYGRRRQVGVQTVTNALGAIATTFKLADKEPPTHVESGRYILPLQRHSKYIDERIHHPHRN